ncbi:MAG: hypothetical protein H6870_00715 [Methylobacteriaceae bacterium]|nr:hypothetical protein [Methylobacteriaceae bacterium]
MVFGFVYIGILMTCRRTRLGLDEEALLRAAGVMPGVVTELAGPHAGARS